jgi:hypothetical protein
MKKFLRVSLALTLAGALVLAGYSIYHSLSGNTVRVYTRFMKEDDHGDRSFNLASIVDPVQIESQELIYDTVRFSKKVIYPLAHDFKCKAPQDSMAEKYVALQISKAINDSLKAIQYRLVYDYDGQSTAVRRASKPHTIPTEKPKVLLFMEGTASPEALKYGMEESLKVGAIEEENTELAKERLDRTNSLLTKNLDSMGVDSVVLVSSSYKELQLSSNGDIPNAIESPEMLDSMRYVKADVVIPLQHVQITPLTSPVLLFLWLLGIIALISFLKKLFSRERAPTPEKVKVKEVVHRKEEPPKLRKVKSYTWIRYLLTSIMMLLGAIAIGYLIHLIPFETLWWWFIIFVILVGLISFAVWIYLLFTNRKEIWPFFKEIIRFFGDVLKFILNAIMYVFIAILLVLAYIYFYGERMIGNFKKWWGKRCGCCKILMIILALHILADILYFIFKD